MFCITNKVFSYLNKLSYRLAGVGQENFPKKYYLANTLDNIFHKEKYYSELTFHYWFWKNKLNKIRKNTWIGFCQKRRFWINKKKQTIKLHFDMHHGYGNLDRAINLLDNDDKIGFRNFVNNSNSFNPHLMFVSKPAVANKWFSKLFPWLLKCEKEFGFKNLKGYDTTRLYAYLAERYLSFWFRKYTKYIEWPIVTLKHY